MDAHSVYLWSQCTVTFLELTTINIFFQDCRIYIWPSKWGSSEIQKAHQAALLINIYSRPSLDPAPQGTFARARRLHPYVGQPRPTLNRLVCSYYIAFPLPVPLLWFPHPSTIVRDAEMDHNFSQTEGAIFAKESIYTYFPCKVRATEFGSHPPNSYPISQTRNSFRWMLQDPDFQSPSEQQQQKNLWKSWP